PGILAQSINNPGDENGQAEGHRPVHGRGNAELRAFGARAGSEHQKDQQRNERDRPLPRSRAPDLDGLTEVRVQPGEQAAETAQQRDNGRHAEQEESQDARRQRDYEGDDAPHRLWLLSSGLQGSWPRMQRMAVETMVLYLCNCKWPALLDNKSGPIAR